MVSLDNDKSGSDTELLYFFALDDFLALIGTTGRAGTVREFR
jgi:hypothetical protein